MKIEDHRQLLDPLTSSGFIGECFHEEAEFQDHVVGSAFLELVTFLGCSPNISLAPQDDTGQGFCFIRLHKFNVLPRLFSGSNSVAPHCKRCHQKRNEWFEILETRNEAGLCTQCTRMDLVDLLTWRKRAALTQLAIEVMNIYPHEAVPSPILIGQLEKYSGVRWGHAYLQEDRNA
ncbi:MAG: hypothetical protein EP297_03625 [Gammaproteobacteria bacterium]|nr:MAG: hypothetical protein EP297_03625 [Gammaproteobacteria bacterium]